ncbi:MAG: DUF4292 domain-containing protein [Bacteroidota bacterium]
MRPLLVLVLLAVAGCSSGPLVRDAPDLAAPADFPNHSAEQIVLLMEAVAKQDSLAAFVSQANVEVRSPERSADLSATIRHRAADTLWASARGPFGIEVARARATPDSVALHDKFNGKLYLGSVDAASQLLPSPLDMQALFDTLLGRLRPDRAAEWTVEIDSSYYVLTGDAERFTVDPASWRTVRYQGFVGERLVDERTFSAFDVVGGRVLPRRVVLRNPAEAAEVRIEHRDLTLNPATLAFPFSPGDAEVIPLD